MHRKDVREKVSKGVKESWTPERKKDFSKNNPMKKTEIAKKLSGKNSVWFGRQHTEESKKKISQANTGRERPKEAIESQREKLKEYWSDPKRISKRKDMKGIKKPKRFSKILSSDWKNKIEIKDNNTILLSNL